MWKTIRRQHINLVLESGGAKTISQLGAIQVLYANNYRFRRISGTSGGAIVGAFMAAGMTAEEAILKLETIDLTEFAGTIKPEGRSWIGAGMEMIRNNRLNDGETLERWLEVELEALGVKTFADLKLSRWRHRRMPAEQRYKLVVMTTDLQSRETIRLPWDYHKLGLDPNTQSVARAVRASASVPFFYQPAPIGDRLLIDGVITAPYPINIFEGDSIPTLGMMVSDQGRRARPLLGSMDQPINLARKYLKIRGADILKLDKTNHEQVNKTLFLNTVGVHELNFKLDRQTQNALITSGRSEAIAYLRRHDNRIPR